jgi:hypothetical protein
MRPVADPTPPPGSLATPAPLPPPQRQAAATHTSATMDARATANSGPSTWLKGGPDAWAGCVSEE